MGFCVSGNKLPLQVFLGVWVFIACSCSDDPYDPLIGPRNPKPGAMQYLNERFDISETQKQALLERKPCSPEFLMEMAKVSTREIRSFVASNPSINSEIIEILLTDKDSGVRQYLASNPQTPRAILVKMRNDADPSVRWILPRNPNWTAEDIREMHKNKITSDSVIAANSSTPPDLLEELAKSADYNTRIALANNPSIPASVSKLLATQQDVSVKIMLTSNTGVHKDILEILSKDSNEGVRNRAATFLKKRSEP